MLTVSVLAILLLQQPQIASPAAQNSVQAAETVYTTTQVDVRPKVISIVDPEYSERARKKRINGSVDVAFVVGKDGVPTDIRLVKGVGYGLDEKAMEAVARYRFSPAIKDGVPVPVQLTITVNFQIF